MNTMTKPGGVIALQTEAAPAPQARPAMGILTPTNLGEAMKMAEILADSSIVPKDFQGRPGNVLIACQWGAEIGLQPLQAMQSIAVINGRPSIWGDAMLGLVQGSGLLESIDEEISEDGQVATCTIRRRGQANAVVRTFTMDEAKRAGLSGKAGPWQQYPRRMLQLRARGFALRDTFADVLRGVAIAEEARDMPVMRDVTPGEPEEPVTAGAKVRNKVAEKKKATAPSLDDVLTRIKAAATEDDLNKVGADCAKLTGDDKDKAREEYRLKLSRLKAPQDPVEDQGAMDLAGATDDPDIGIFVSHVESLLRAELDAGAELTGVMETYAEQLDTIRKQDSDALDQMLDRIRADFPA